MSSHLATVACATISDATWIWSSEYRWVRSSTTLRISGGRLYLVGVGVQRVCAQLALCSTGQPPTDVSFFRARVNRLQEAIIQVTEIFAIGSTTGQTQTQTQTSAAVAARVDASTMRPGGRRA